LLTDGASTKARAVFVFGIRLEHDARSGFDLRVQTEAMNMSLRFNSTMLTAIAAMVLTTGCHSTPKASTDSATASVTKLGGGARLTYDGRTWLPLRVGMGINPGCVVQTAINSYVEIVAAEATAGRSGGKDEVETTPLRNRLLIEADAIVRLDSLPTPGIYFGESDIRLSLNSGRVMCAGLPSSESPVMEVRFAKSVVRGRGATFLVQADGLVQVARGAVAVTAPDLVTGRAVSEGLQLNTKTGELSKISIGGGEERPVVKPAFTPPPRLDSGPPLRAR
jgi:hypothetical protein